MSSICLCGTLSAKQKQIEKYRHKNPKHQRRGQELRVSCYGDSSSDSSGPNEVICKKILDDNPHHFDIGPSFNKPYFFEKLFKKTLQRKL